MTHPPLKAPFPYFGGKSRAAAEIWRRLGNVSNYVEPFFGSGAVLLGRPQPFSGVETVNDVDGLLCNLWRAIQADPDAVAEWAEWPVNECDLHARHAWLVGRKDSLQARLEGDPDYHDAKAAGWWCWGLCCWIGSGWCSGDGPWHVVDQDGIAVLARSESDGRGINRKLPHLSDGRGINRKLPHLGDAGVGIGRGVKRKLPHLGDAGMGMHRRGAAIQAEFRALAARLRDVRVCCGDWSRVCGDSVTIKHGLTAVLLDPPYSAEADRDLSLYRVECGQVAHDVRAWALERGGDPRYRIALCGYEGEHDELERHGWTVWEWKANGGYGNQGDTRGRTNAGRERIWFNPACVTPAQQGLMFGEDAS